MTCEMAGKCSALLMAERLIREDNGKRGISGAFNTFNSPGSPASAPHFHVDKNLEDFSGVHEFSVAIA